MLTLATPAAAHLENETACDMISNFVPAENATPYFNGPAGDLRDWVIEWRWDRQGKTARLEVHYWLAPQAQWKDKEKPEVLLDVPSSFFMDVDGSGWDYWILDPRMRLNCEDMLVYKHGIPMLDEQGKEVGWNWDVDYWTLWPHDQRRHDKEKI